MMRTLIQGAAGPDAAGRTYRRRIWTEKRPRRS